MSDDYAPSTDELIARARQQTRGITDPSMRERLIIDLADALESVRAEERRLPVPSDGCVCTWYTQDAGGGYSETVSEYEPACPEHSEHVWDPRQGMWVSRAEERDRIARSIEAQGITARDVPQNKDWMAVIHTRKADARIAREGA